MKALATNFSIEMCCDVSHSRIHIIANILILNNPYVHIANSIMYTTIHNNIQTCGGPVSYYW